MLVASVATVLVAALLIPVGAMVANAQVSSGETRPKAVAQKPPVGASAVKSPDGLSNSDVIHMVAAKLSDDIILNAIEDATKKTFDLSPSGLVALKNGGVSDEIIRVMQRRPRSFSPTPAPTPATVAPSVTTAAPAVASAPTPAAGTDPSSPNSDDKKAEHKKSGKMRRFALGGLLGVAIGKSNAQDGPTGSAQELKNGETAVVSTTMTVADATSKVKAFLNGRNLDFTVNPDTARMTTDWFADRRCGPGIQHCANKAPIRVSAEDGKTEIRIQVIERKREGGASEKPWHENSKSRGKETMKFAAELEAYLGQGR